MINRRRGYALVEVLVVMTIVATMLTLCAGMIHLLLKQGMDYREVYVSPQAA